MQQHRSKGLLNGWPFVGVAALAILASVAAAIAITPELGDAAARVVHVRLALTGDGRNELSVCCV